MSTHNVVRNLFRAFLCLAVLGIVLAGVVCGLHGPMDADCDCPACVLGRISLATTLSGAVMAFAIGLVAVPSRPVMEVRPSTAPLYSVRLNC